MWPGVTMEEQSSSSGAAPTPAPKSKALWIVVAVIVVVVVVLAAAVLGGLFAPTKAHLRIGTLLSLTGGLALFGSAPMFRRCSLPLHELELQVRRRVVHQ